MSEYKPTKKEQEMLDLIKSGIELSNRLQEKYNRSEKVMDKIKYFFELLKPKIFNCNTTLIIGLTIIAFFAVNTVCGFMW